MNSQKSAIDIGEITTQELSVQLDNPDSILLDIRPSAAYNGWQLQEEVRGGHIRGAVSFPCGWVKGLSTSDLKSLLSSKKVSSKKNNVVYGYLNDDCAEIADLLWNAGIRNISIYDAGLQEWAAEPNLPMQYLEKFSKLVHAKWIAELISRERIRYEPEFDPKIFEVGWEAIEEYKAGHIPGAMYLELSRIEPPPAMNIISDDDLLDFLLSQGIRRDSTVILYARNTMAAARAANILMFAGVKDVRILDGGFDAWVEAGFEIETFVQEPTPAEGFGGIMPGHPEYIIDMEGVKALLVDDRGVLVSVRSWEEYIGEKSGYDYIQAKGHITGAVWGYSGSDPYQLQDFRNPDNTMRSYHEIESNWREVNITPDRKIAFYCGSGWRASEAFFYAYLMGWENIAVYDGGWLEWSRDQSNPISQGAPQDRRG